MTSEPTQNSSCLARLPGLMLRLIFVIVVGIAVGAGVYFGLQAFYTQFLSPVQEHALRLAALEARLEQAESTSQQRLEGFSGRVDAVERQGDAIKEALSDLDSRIEGIEAAQATQSASAQAMLESLDGIENAIAEIQQEGTAQQETIASLQALFEAEIADLETNSETLQAEVEEANQAALGNMKAIQEFQIAIRWEMQILRAMELLTRARLNLVQGNLSLALVDLQRARNLLEDMQVEASASQKNYLEEVMARLDAALEFLPREPVSAADGLEGAWQLLLESLPQETPAPRFQAIPLTPEGTPTRQPTPTPTP
jgi:chromosome segregation ATPase